MKYPSDWSDPYEEYQNTTNFPDYPVYLAYLCPSSVLEKQYVPTCSSNSTVNLELNDHKLKDGTTLKEFHNDQISPDESWEEQFKDIVGTSKYITTTKLNISRLTAIQTISTHSSSGGLLDRFAQGLGYSLEPSIGKNVKFYMVNGSNGYTITGKTDDEGHFNIYYPTFQKIIYSIQIKGAKENPENTPTDDVILVSQKLKNSSGYYNDIVGQVKNIGTKTVDLVKIGLTLYDENGDVVGTGSTYAESTTLKPNQKSTFDISLHPKIILTA